VVNIPNVNMIEPFEIILFNYLVPKLKKNSISQMSTCFKALIIHRWLNIEKVFFRLPAHDSVNFLDVRNCI